MDDVETKIQEEQLRMSVNEIKKMMNAQSAMTHLYSAGVIDNDDMKRIVLNAIPSEMVQRLIVDTLIPTLKRDDAFKKLIDALNATEQEHVVTEIQRHGK